MHEINLQTSDAWSSVWVKHIESYLSATPRCGIWIDTLLRNRNISVLECAGGSCRDSRYLFTKGYEAEGSDFDEKTIKYVSEKFRNSDFPVKKQDAFAFSFEDSSFDVTFHNGFWIYFEENVDIIRLLKEQVRITKKYAIILVHNSKNVKLVRQFEEKSKADDLYKIRFFSTEDLHKILSEANLHDISFSIEKFGGVVDRLYGIGKRIKLLDKGCKWIVPKLYKFQPWSKVERIALVIKLDNTV
jgi:2-polyprenyl-3-methyl-5-hydroxy-6-metoxy-1,4-benzoquinol methylase